MVTVDDELVLIQHGRTAETMDTDKPSRADDPTLITIVVVGRDDHIPGCAFVLTAKIGFEKTDINRLAVGDGCTRSVAIQIVQFL